MWGWVEVLESTRTQTGDDRRENSLDNRSEVDVSLDRGGLGSDSEGAGESE